MIRKLAAILGLGGAAALSAAVWTATAPPAHAYCGDGGSLAIGNIVNNCEDQAYNRAGDHGGCTSLPFLGIGWCNNRSAADQPLPQPTP